ncbi:protein prenylyltransferase [Cantharellus anzutake]|uniref:protein prenylyltransferase n=1 Tax=Cantharellus anzutake TaxID=1750568 RepID=UPI001906D130|nr:protein prenylyltransferase [Cantharellus anzutake]KAF8312741.1 protein prenylyltransferase [Cantharellus anzutake]
MASPDLTLDSLSAQFPLTWPIPTPLRNPDLLTPKDIHREEDLLRNASSFRLWWTTIAAVRDSVVAEQKAAPASSLPTPLTSLIGPLSTPAARLGLQKLTYLYESALTHFPSSFKLWKAYLQMRCLYVFGRGSKPKRAGGRNKWADMKVLMEEEEFEFEQYQSGLDPVVGWSEWKSLIAVFERALMWLPTMPRIWLLYVNLFTHPQCPAPVQYTHARRTFDRALRTLPPSLHARIWPRYLLWAELKGGMTTVVIYRRFLAIDPSLTERYVSLLLHGKPGSELEEVGSDDEEPGVKTQFQLLRTRGAQNEVEPRPLEAAKLLLSLARKAARGEYTSPEGKSPYQLLGEWLDVCERFADEVGLEPEVADAERAAAKASKDKLAKDDAERSGKEIENQDGRPPRARHLDEDPANPSLLDVGRIVKEDGLAIYKDQAGRLWSGLATYWTKRGEFDRAQATFEEGIATVLTIRDFTQIFDAYAEFSESVVSALMDSLADPEEDEDEGALADTEKELDERMRKLEELMDRRPFLVNDVLIRRNPNDVQEWEKRVALWGDDDDKVAETYTQAMETINPRKATPNYHNIFVNFAKFYEQGGVTGTAVPDLDSARRVFEKGTKTPFRTVEELAEVWCEWAEMEIRNENYDEGIRVMQRATAIPKNTKISYHDQSLPVQARLFKSLKLWSYYVDLEESIGTVETTKRVYDQMLELRIANAQIIVNYAAFLEENKYFEESFKAYERGVEVFTYPISFEIWNSYLSKFVKRYGGTKLERARDLFEQALEKCPEKFCKPIFFMYAQLEEEHGLSKRAMKIYERASEVVADADKFEIFTVYIAKATENFGLPATRPIYERALEVLPNRQAAQMCLRFAALERKLGEIDRARAIYAHASQFCDPRVEPRFWTEWNSFEIETGSEDTFREMLRIKRSVQAQFNTAASYLVAKTENTKQGTLNEQDTASGAPLDAMAAAERATLDKPKGPSFVPAKQSLANAPAVADDEPSVPATNADEIQIDDEF